MILTARLHPGASTVVMRNNELYQNGLTNCIKEMNKAMKLCGTAHLHQLHGDKPVFPFLSLDFQFLELATTAKNEVQWIPLNGATG